MDLTDYYSGLRVFFIFVDFFLLFIILLFIIITFFISSVLEHYMAAAFNLPGLSLPFVITLFIFIIFLEIIIPMPSRVMTVRYISMPNSAAGSLDYFRSLSLYFAFREYTYRILIAGVILIFSSSMFLVSVIAFAANYFFVHLLRFESETFLLISGFNSILTAFALGGSLIIISRKTDFPCCLIKS
jgi:hypothetical protein